MTKHAQYLAASAVLASASLSGCATVKSLDGTESATLNPVEARIEADRYRRQAEHLDTVADMTEGLITRAWDTVSTAVSSNPSLAALLGPAGLYPAFGWDYPESDGTLYACAGTSTVGDYRMHTNLKPSTACLRINSSCVPYYQPQNLELDGPKIDVRVGFGLGPVPEEPNPC